MQDPEKNLINYKDLHSFTLTIKVQTTLKKQLKYSLINQVISIYRTIHLFDKITCMVEQFSIQLIFFIEIDNL